MGEVDITGQTLAGKYKIVGTLGQGGMGLVWKGMHVRTGRKLAIKILDERFLSNDGVVQRFGREARAASAIQHPGIVEVLDLDQTEDGAPFLVMEMLSGETLARRIDSRGRLSQAETLEIFTQLLEALGAAHDHGVVHRDLKPDNIFLVPKKRGGESVKILDFGISQKDDERVAELTMAGSVLGTPHYMAPEQAMGDPKVDGRVDIYAAGVVMYECLVGDVPFDAPNYNRLIQVILNDEPVPPSARDAEVEEGVERVILQALQKDPAQRPQTAADMLSALRHGGARQEAQAAARGGMQAGVLQAGVRQVAVRQVGIRQVGGGPASAAAVARTPAESPLPSSPAAIALQGSEAPALPPLRAPADEPLPSIGDLVIGTPTRRSGRHAPVSVDKAVASTPPPPATPIPQAQGDVGDGKKPADPLSFEAAFSDAAAGADELELDEVALTQSARASRVRSLRPQAPSSAGAIPARMPSSSGGLSGVTTGRPGVAGGRTPWAGQEAVERPTGWFRRLPNAVWYLLVGLLVFGAAVVALRVLVRPGGDRVAPSAPVPLDVSEPAETSGRNVVRVDIAGLPAGATVELDGLPAGSLPMRVRRGTTHTVEISAPGYETRRITFTADADRRLSANLRAQEGTSAGRSIP